MAGGIGALKERVTGTVADQRARRPWLEHLIRAYGRLTTTNGNHLAAAITYFSFLALFPVILLAISVAGFVLATNDDLQVRLQEAIRDNVPGSIGRQLSDSVVSIIANRGTIGIVGVLGVAFAGLGWIGNLRTALQVVWSCKQTKENLLKAKLGDLLVLVGLGLGILVSLALTAGGTAAADSVLRLVRLDDVPGMFLVTAAVGLLLALAADTAIFAWLFVRLPRRPVRYRTVLRGAVFAAVGYEVLKVVGTFYLTRVTSNPTYGPFAGAIGLLVWINLVSRFLLFSAAWTATGEQPGGLVDCGDGDPEEGFAVGTDERPQDGRGVVGPVPSAGGREPVGARGSATPSPAAVAGALVGAGAALGAGAATAGRRYLRRRR